MTGTSGGDAGDVTIVSVAFNSAEVIGQMLASRPAGAPAVIVDNASIDDSVAVCRAAGARVIALEANVGFGTAASVGGFAAQTPYLLFANPDVEFLPEAAARMRAALDSDPNLGAVGPTLYDGETVRPQKLFNFISDKIGPSSDGPRCVNGCCFMMRTELFHRLGGFDRRIFLFYEEDDLFHRMRVGGAEIALVPDAGVRHVYGRSSGASVRYQVAWLRWFHDIESKLYVSQKWRMQSAPWKDLRRGAVRAFLGVVSVNRRQVVEGAGRFWAAALWLGGRRLPPEQQPTIRADHTPESGAAAASTTGSGTV